MKTIITVQHTQSIHHTNGMVGSWTDWELSELGLEQAEKIGRKLQSELTGKKHYSLLVGPAARKADCRKDWQTPECGSRIKKRAERAQPWEMLWKISPMAPRKYGTAGKNN